MAPEMGFETGLDRLDSVVTALESGHLGLDEALARYEEGVRLLARCHALLDDADRKVALLTGVTDDGSPLVEPFDASATSVQEPSAPRKKKPAAPADGDGEGLDDLPF